MNPKQLTSLGLVLAICFCCRQTALAQDASQPVNMTILEVASAVERTPTQMLQDELTIGNPHMGTVPPFRPTMDLASYHAAKAAVSHAVGVRPLPPALATSAPLAVASSFNFAGDIQSEAGGFFPPDTHGAVGRTQFAEITNSHFDVYSKSTGARLNGAGSGVSLASLLGYTVKALFDPRIVYDRLWNRWVLTADAFPESTTVQKHFIAISKTSDATGSFIIYSLNVTFATGDFWDFPQLGMDQDAIIITANIFSSSGSSKGADMLCVAKALLYNGRGFSVPVFTGLVGTLAPPIVLDQNASTFLVAAPPASSALKLYTLTNSSHAFSAKLSAPVSISVAAYTVPPNAQQPTACAGTSAANKLDTSDNRFVNASTQNGNFLYQTHTITSGGTATPKFYKINTSTKTVADSGLYFATASSHDFNASIAADTANNIFVTWSSTDPSASRNADVRFSGKLASAAAGNLPAGGAIFTSSTCLTGNFDSNFGAQRWGDYSAVSLDPSTSRKVWIVNEDIISSGVWGSRIGSVTQ